LPVYLRRSVALDQVAGRDASKTLPLRQLLEQVERRLIELALRTSKGNNNRAASLLDISRSVLLRRIEALKIES
jgi:transcriptional regulator with PAS, ATPase and Fis domain